MNKMVVGKGKTIEDAINAGLKELGVTLDEVETNVVQVPESGVFGIFGKKEAVVEVTVLNNAGKTAEVFLGEMLDAMNIPCTKTSHLVSLVVNRSGEKYIRVVQDTENYRSKRQKTLEALAEKMASKAVRYGKKMSLEPMNPSERRIIHAKLQNSDKVFTFSEGDEPYRHVVIQLKDK